MTTLVFLHYFGGSADTWIPVTRLLPKPESCVTLDLPGFGDCPLTFNPSIHAYADWITATIVSRGIDRCVLVGHSMGGKLAMAIAAKQSRMRSSLSLDGLLLVAPSPATTEPMSMADKDELTCLHPSKRCGEKMLRSSAMLTLDPSFQKRVIDDASRASREAWHWWLYAGMTHSIADDVAAINLPVHVLASADDPVIPISCVKQDVVGLISNAKIDVVDGVGHLMPLEDPPMVAAWIGRSALGQVSGQTAS